MNEVQAMEELEMTSPEQFAGNDRFTWIPFYMEMAKKLLEYKDDRRELVKIVYEMDENTSVFSMMKTNSRSKIYIPLHCMVFLIDILLSKKGRKFVHILKNV